MGFINPKSIIDKIDASIKKSGKLNEALKWAKKHPALKVIGRNIFLK
jgi:hypothetical protein